MATHSTAQWHLPGREERQQIIETAKLVLAEAKAVAARLDRVQAMQSEDGLNTALNAATLPLVSRDARSGAAVDR